MDTGYSTERGYEKIFANQQAMLKDMLNGAYANSAAVRSEAERIAEENRKKGIKNAYVTYDRSLNTYGQNAEALAQNGLTNSGYSDYLGGVAYSNMVGNIDSVRQTADEAFRKAAYDEAQANANARSSYNSNLIALENARAEAELAYGNNFNTAMEKAAEGGFGEFTEGNKATDVANIAKAYNISEADAASVYEKAVLAYSDIKKAAYDEAYQKVLALATEGKLGDGAGNVSSEALMEAFGFTETDVNTLIDVNASAYDAIKGEEMSDKFITFSLEIYKALNEGAYKPNEIMSVINNSGLTEYQKDTLTNDVNTHIERMRQENYENYIFEIKNGTLDTTLVDRALENEEISQSHYNDLKMRYNENIDKTETFFSDVSYEDAKTVLNNVINNSWVDEATKESLTNAYTKVYAREIAREVAGISISDNAKVVDINSSDYKKSDLGKNIDNPKSPQGIYLTAIAADAKADKIKVGQTIQTDLGVKDAIYVYIGEGLFVQTTWRTHVNQYLPEGYYTYESGGDVKVGVGLTYQDVVSAGKFPMTKNEWKNRKKEGTYEQYLVDVLKGKK